MPRKIINRIGQKFNKLKVIKFSGYDKNNRPQWLCKCDCGNLKDVRGDHLAYSRSTISCGCSKNLKGKESKLWKGYQEISGTFFREIKHSAKDRNIKFNITIEQIWDLFLKQKKKCALSGVELCFIKTFKKRDGTASIDRIDSRKNYTINNIQWVHKDINFMKQDNTDEKFIKWCGLVYKYNL